MMERYEKYKDSGVEWIGDFGQYRKADCPGRL